MDKKNPEFYMEVHCIIHQRSFCGESMKPEHIMEVVALIVTFTQPHGIHHHQLQSFVVRN
jgi:hypothetical protein